MSILKLANRFEYKLNALATAQSTKSISSIGPWQGIKVPQNAVLPDGSVNIMFNIRGSSGSAIGPDGLNAVVVSGEAGGMGDKENAQTYGNASVVNQAVKHVLEEIQKQNPDKKIHLGKLGLSSWSGGYEAVRKILSQKDQLVKKPDAVTIFDGIHNTQNYDGTVKKKKDLKINEKSMQTWVDLAADARKDPSTKFVVVHTAVPTDKYVSTTQSADYLLNNTGVQRKPIDNDDDWSVQKPATVAQDGGFQVYQLFDKEHPYMINGKANVPGTSGYQHILADKSKNDIWRKVLAPEWNTPGAKAPPAKPVTTPATPSASKPEKGALDTVKDYFTDAANTVKEYIPESIKNLF